jgi:hypothetical protein
LRTYGSSGRKWARFDQGGGGADAAGLPIFPGLVHYDEIDDGEIKHALCFTVSKSQAISDISCDR